MNEKDTIKIGVPFKGMIGHRGCAGLQTENTLKAFIEGGSRTYCALECDVHPSLDKLIVVSHDASLKRVGLVDINIPEHNYEEIRSYKFPDLQTGEVSEECFAPLLSEYLDVCIKYDKDPVIELKETNNDESVLETIRIVKEKNMLERTTFISFYPGYLVLVREKCPNVKIQFLTSAYDEGVLDLCIHYNFGIDAFYKLVNQELINDYHKNGLEVNCWTVNEKEVALKLIEYGIDYITTNILE